MSETLKSPYITIKNNDKILGPEKCTETGQLNDYLCCPSSREGQIHCSLYYMSWVISIETYLTLKDLNFATIFAFSPSKSCYLIPTVDKSSVSVLMSRYWARGKFGEHERGVRVVPEAAGSNSSLLSALQTSQVLNISKYAQLKHKLIVL